jgi:hypothetical protein
MKTSAVFHIPAANTLLPKSMELSPSFIAATSVSLAITLVGMTVLMRKYGAAKVMETIPTRSFDIGMLLGVLFCVSYYFYECNCLGR